MVLQSEMMFPHQAGHGYKNQANYSHEEEDYYSYNDGYGSSSMQMMRPNPNPNFNSHYFMSAAQPPQYHVAAAPGHSYPRPIPHHGVGDDGHYDHHYENKMHHEFSKTYGGGKEHCYDDDDVHGFGGGKHHNLHDDHGFGGDKHVFGGGDKHGFGGGKQHVISSVESYYGQKGMKNKQLNPALAAEGYKFLGGGGGGGGGFGGKILDGISRHQMSRRPDGLFREKQSDHWELKSIDD
ncbi:unnamed protein product [Cuscuta epithymum]|uniref:Uncharacterized protein n=1 Tax=Cuscuta epithymum TaxID=186058 RepID=A0AAV0C3H4_9ASTE|nr:unnamed protein product [Cuscuta epithymum]